MIFQIVDLRIDQRLMRKHILQNPMHHQIGVAANGRGEVRIMIEGKSVMSDVLRGVYGLGHAANGEVLQNILLRFALDLGHEAVQFCRDVFR